MDDAACVDQTQAEQYIALTALHALTFPRSQGFASHSGGASKLTFFRLLPPSARDLWDKLEDARKLREDSTNRQVWAKLRSIIQPKLDPRSKVRNIGKNDCCPISDNLDPQVIGKASKAIYDKKNHLQATTHSKNVETDSERLIAAYRSLQQSSNYQEMLVRGVLVHVHLSLTLPFIPPGFSGKPSYRSPQESHNRDAGAQSSPRLER
jgi:ATP-dependent RNA helicase DHX29